MKNVGFTLAEILITLGIIGVVSAMTLPTLFAQINGNKYRAQLKKTISNLSNAARMSESLYGFDFAGINTTCSANGASDHPDNIRSICAMFNGTLKGTTYYETASDIKMQVKGQTQNYAITSSQFATEHSLTENSSFAFVLADGTIIMISKKLGTSECSLSIGDTIKDRYSGNSEMRYCYGYIDVNGAKLPNKEVTCSSGSNNIEHDTCVVKNDANHMTDIYPVRIHDGIVEPATAAVRYVLKTAK